MTMQDCKEIIELDEYDPSHPLELPKTRMKSTMSIQFKVDKGRVLVPVGEPCPFGCKYCYTRSGEVGPKRVDPADILQRFNVFAQTHPFDFIQFGYDGEPFAHPERGLAMLQQLAMYGKNLSFSTKAFIQGRTLETLEAIQKTMLLAQTTLTGLVSLSCWDSASSVEPHTPTPYERIKTLTNLKSVLHISYQHGNMQCLLQMR